VRGDGLNVSAPVIGGIEKAEDPMSADTYKVGNPLLHQIVNDYVGAATAHDLPRCITLHTVVYSTV
jgi:hypothetical protein